MSIQTQRQRKEHDGSLATTGRERKHVPGVVAPFLLRELIAGLTPVEWTVWSVCFLHANREMFCCLKHETIVFETGVGVNAVHRAKRGLIAKGWLTNTGQSSNGRGPNLYRLTIPIPEPVGKFIGLLWEVLNREPWWETRVGADKIDFVEDHLDWLIAWRVIRILKETDRTLSGEDDKSWTPQAPITHELRDAALATFLDRLRHASESLNHERGLWWLFGSGLDSNDQ